MSYTFMRNAGFLVIIVEHFFVWEDVKNKSKNTILSSRIFKASHNRTIHVWLHFHSFNFFFSPVMSQSSWIRFYQSFRRFQENTFPVLNQFMQEQKKDSEVINSFSSEGVQVHIFTSNGWLVKNETFLEWKFSGSRIPW